ncbi:hypothetical protein IPC1147_33180 [Pseudomonas aeruginosa]|uniref:hypothetical protein n=1 Tax=Pseudomonas aeruginosa TaxID=287 RepID=UPI000FFF177E|nr:hypothetical protein [Pseudomonas aeruginosa]MBA5107643.1 hypothetical protein [Pseudomonas aeruginosa]MBD1300082.1 hypothetical protein [Pseudomonas aeruginosa]MBD1340647.1 hypothetical protein [Pseudomonas aeruginosa]MCO2528463.1 hypothetical protein [Pseudomonas aeruginosa]MCO2541437.1 hypothetical protein [Pseudomonas aeruginosa]
MSGLFITLAVLFFVVGFLYTRHFVKPKSKTPRQEPSVERRDGYEENQQASPFMAEPAKAAPLKLQSQASSAPRGATRVNQLPDQPDYSEYDAPTFLRRNVELSFAA